jgi:hypothetical protein
MKPSAKQTFQATLTARGPKGAWTHLSVPFNVEAAFGGRGMVKVAGTINGFGFRTSLMPNGDGTHHLVVTKEMMAGGVVGQGEVATLTLEPDTAPRVVEVPADLAKALKGPLRAAFDRMSYSHRKEYVTWIEGAKKPETRARRVEQAAVKIAQAAEKIDAKSL